LPASRRGCRVNYPVSIASASTLCPRNEDT
jgi:hypothetical protein